MTGQWVGKSYPEEEPARAVIVNVEPRTPNFAQLISFDAVSQLRTISDATIEISGDSFKGKAFGCRVFVPEKERFYPIAEYCKLYGIETEAPSGADYSGAFVGRKIQGEFKNNLGRKGTFELWDNFSEALTGDPAEIVEESPALSWDDFKKHVAQFRFRGKTLFRGQHSNKYRLQTSFHRAGRNSISRYLAEDVERLRHQINALTNHYYQRFGEDLNGLLSLAQHHGFPTPLLDWTESPYVAAFFAFDCLSDRAKWKNDGDAVRIFTFDWEKWKSINRLQVGLLQDPLPDFQFFHPPAHNNTRYYPQQSIAAFSNVDDIEGFIASIEKVNKMQCLTKIDIRASERDVVEGELRFMGITAATLFPGFEGACKSLRSELF